MTTESLRRSAARSAARRHKKEPISPSDRPAMNEIPKGIVKTTPSGRRYRVTVVPLELLPRFFALTDLEPRTYFYFIPEGDYCLGVRPRGWEETQEEDE